MNVRVAARTLGVTATLVVAWIAHEGFSEKPIIPTKGDVPTIGHGSTQYEDGTRVKLTDPAISRTRARELAVNLLEKQYVKCVRDSLGDTPVHVVEFEQAVDLAGNMGCGNWRGSSMERRTKAGDYAGACKAYLLYRFQNKRDCALPVNWGPQGCKGVWERAQQRAEKCMEVQ